MPTQAALTVAEAADELNTTELNISRLYARGDLKAHRLGVAGQLRIMSDDLNRYIAAGAPSYDAPKVEGGWLADPDYRMAQAFEIAARQATDDQVAPEHPGKEEIAIAINDQVRRILRQQQPLLRLQVTPEPPRRLWVDAYFASRFRAILGLLANEATYESDLGGTIGRLYANPDAYKALINAAVRGTLDGGITASRMYARPWPADSLRTTYTLRHADMIDAARMRQIASDAT